MIFASLYINNETDQTCYLLNWFTISYYVNHVQKEDRGKIEWEQEQYWHADTLNHAISLFFLCMRKNRVYIQNWWFITQVVISPEMISSLLRVVNNTIHSNDASLLAHHKDRMIHCYHASGRRICVWERGDCCRYKWKWVVINEAYKLIDQLDFHLAKCCSIDSLWAQMSNAACALVSYSDDPLNELCHWRSNLI